MNTKESKRIRRKMWELGIDPNAPEMKPRSEVVEVRTRMVKTPKVMFGIPTKEYETTFERYPIYRQVNPYRQIFEAIAEGRYDFETKTIKKS